MSTTDNSEFIQSSCLQLVSSNDASVVMAHVLSGKKYALGREAFNLLKSLKEPSSFEQLQVRWPHIPAEKLRATLKFLREKELIYLHENGVVNETFHITSLNQRLCNIDQFSLSGAQLPQVVFLGVPYGKGNAISPGTARAPHALRRFSHRLNADFKRTRFVNTDGWIYDVASEVELSHLRSMIDQQCLADWGDLYIYPHEYPHHVYEKIERATSILIERNHIPFILGGDHSITYPVLKAFNRKYENLHVLHFDAHTDTYSSNLEQVFRNRSTHNHGNFASLSLELENVSQIYQLGVRGLNNLGVKQLDKQQIWGIGKTKRMARGREEISLPDGVPYYVTLDIDVLDPAVAPGTASPVPGGLSYPDLLQILELLLKDRWVVGLDLVEINPERDRDNVTVQIGLEVITFLLNMLHPARD